MSIFSLITNKISHAIIDSKVEEKLYSLECNFEQNIKLWGQRLRNDFIVVASIAVLGFVSKCLV